MALTSDQTSELSLKLIKKLVEHNLSRLTWTDIESGIMSLTADEKNLIADSLANNSTSNLGQFISNRLRIFLEDAVIAEVTNIIKSGSISLDLLYIIMK